METDAPGDGEPTDAGVDDSDFAEAGNGEIARADEFQVTEAKRESDKNLRSVRDFARKEWPLRGSVADDVR